MSLKKMFTVSLSEASRTILLARVSRLEVLKREMLNSFCFLGRGRIFPAKSSSSDSFVDKVKIQK